MWFNVEEWVSTMSWGNTRWSVRGTTFSVLHVLTASSSITSEYSECLVHCNEICRPRKRPDELAVLLIEQKRCIWLPSRAVCSYYRQSSEPFIYKGHQDAVCVVGPREVSERGAQFAVVLSAL